MKEEAGEFRFVQGLNLAPINFKMMALAGPGVKFSKHTSSSKKALCLGHYINPSPPK